MVKTGPIFTISRLNFMFKEVCRNYSEFSCCLFIQIQHFHSQSNHSHIQIVVLLTIFHYWLAVLWTRPFHHSKISNSIAQKNSPKKLWKFDWIAECGQPQKTFFVLFIQLELKSRKKSFLQKMCSFSTVFNGKNRELCSVGSHNNYFNSDFRHSS